MFRQALRARAGSRPAEPRRLPRVDWPAVLGARRRGPRLPAPHRACSCCAGSASARSPRPRTARPRWSCSRARGRPTSSCATSRCPGWTAWSSSGTSPSAELASAVIIASGLEPKVVHAVEAVTEALRAAGARRDREAADRAPARRAAGGLPARPGGARGRRAGRGDGRGRRRRARRRADRRPASGRSSIWRPAASAAPRRSPAGTTRPTAGSRPPAVLPVLEADAARQPLHRTMPGPGLRARAGVRARRTRHRRRGEGAGAQPRRHGLADRFAEIARERGADTAPDRVRRSASARSGATRPRWRR